MTKVSFHSNDDKKMGQKRFGDCGLELGEMVDPFAGLRHGTGPRGDPSLPGGPHPGTRELLEDYIDFMFSKFSIQNYLFIG